MAFTPTRYLRAGDRDTLRAVVAAVERLDRIEMAVVIPTGVGWLLDANIGLITAALDAITHPVALALGGQFNPPDRHRLVTANYRRLLVDVPGVAPWRSDFATFDGIAHGAPFASLGETGTLRHIVPPGEQAQSSGPPGAQPPTVLVPELMGFFRGDTLATRYAGAPAPICRCQVCRGAGLDRFDGLDGETRAEAHAHNAAVWNNLLPALFGQPGLGDQQVWWRGTCAAAVDAYAVENARILQAGAFKPKTDLKRWATLPVTHAPTPQRVEEG